MRLVFLLMVVWSSGLSRAQKSWFFWYECFPGVPGCEKNNARSFCTPPNRPQFRHVAADPEIEHHPFAEYLKLTQPSTPSPKISQASTNRNGNKNNAVNHVVDGVDAVDSAPTSFGLDGIASFATNSEYVAAIWSVGFFIVLGITVWRGCGVVDRHPELAVSLIEGCVTCRTGKRKAKAKTSQRSAIKPEDPSDQETIELSEKVE